MIGRGFQRVGWSVAYVPSRDYNNTSAGSFGPYGDIKDRILTAVDGVSAEMLIWVACKQDYPSGLCAELRALRPELRLLYHSYDDPFIIGTDYYKSSSEFDAAVTCCEGSIVDYRELGIPAVCLYPPFDSDIHTKAALDTNALCDLSFIATNLYPPEQYAHSQFNRADIVRAVRHLGELSLYGPWAKRFGWGGPYGVPELQDRWKGELCFARLAGVYKASRVNLNSHVRPDGSMYLNERFTNVLGSRAFMLVDNVNGLEALERESGGFVIYNDLKDLVSKAEFYLKNDRARAKVADAGLRLAEARFSNSIFAATLIRFVAGL